jgi:homoserine dehydrogenase
MTEGVDRLSDIAAMPLMLRRVLVRDLSKTREHTVPAELLTGDIESILSDPDVAIVVELIGGVSPAYDYICRAISRGKHVATANKDVMARHGTEILALAQENGVHVLFEASVGAGIPIIGPLTRDLAVNDVRSINGIINGTTNYILTKMAKEGVDFADVLADAQRLGYAEPDPTNDVEGIDAAYKLAILATLAFRTSVRDTDVFHEGITRLRARDFRYAEELGYTIKLLALGRKDNGGIQVRVHPALVPSNSMIAKVDGVLNAVEVDTDLAGRVLFHGRGAGALPTTSAVVSDVLQIAQRIVGGVKPHSPNGGRSQSVIRPMSDLETRYYLRMTVAERPGVLAQITRVIGDLHISIASIIQKEIDYDDLKAEIVIITNLAREASVQDALSHLDKLDVVLEVGNMIRVEDL